MDADPVPDPPRLSDPERRCLLEIARDAVRTGLEGRQWRAPERDLPERLRQPGACFVTLRREGRLLGCVGSIEPVRPLAEDAAANAVAAAFRDPRLPPVTAQDERAMRVGTSVLGPLAALLAAGLDELQAVLRPGIDGLVVTAGPQRATFLPAVWHQLPDPVAFLDALWEKAGLRPGAWPADLELCRYRTLTFGEQDPPGEATPARPQASSGGVGPPSSDPAGP